MSVGIAYTGVVPSNGQGYLVGAGPNDFTAAELIADFILTLSGNYGGAATHGDAISFANVAIPGCNLGDYAPVWAEFWELVPAGTLLPGFKYTYCPGPTLAAPTLNGGVLQITGTGAASGQGGTEIAQAGAYSGTTPSLNGQQIKMRMYFTRGQ